MLIKNFIHKLWTNAMLMNKSNILSMMDTNSKDILLDLGCSDGVWTNKIASYIGASEVWGLDVYEPELVRAKANGIRTVLADLDQKIPLESNKFNVIHANQVIEHVSSVDNFASEVYRLLQPNGYAIISTENTSSWCNIVSSIFGWQPFSSTNLSSMKSGIGNPISLHRNANSNLISSWTHKTLFSYRGLKEFFSAHGFIVESVKGAGYFPLPAIFAKFDPRHSHFITIKIKKSS